MFTLPQDSPIPQAAMAQAHGAADDWFGSSLLGHLCVALVLCGLCLLAMRALRSRAGRPPASQHGAPKSQRGAPASQRGPASQRTPPSQRQRHSERAANSAHAAPVSERAPVSGTRVRRRVILLHAITPGQTAHEYNVGDDEGTRGIAHARVA